MTNEEVRVVRLRVLEEVRQAMKYASWPITSLSLLEKELEYLSSIPLPRRYSKRWIDGL